MKDLYGGIEAGGTKFVCMVGRGPGDVTAEVRFPTTMPSETIQSALEFFYPYARQGRLAAVGIGSFGPVDLNPNSETYGYITSTPKNGWAYTNLYGAVQRALDVPVAFDTDVNAAAFGEQFWGRENRGLDPFLYMTVGTGIGVGVLVNGQPVHGLRFFDLGHNRGASARDFLGFGDVLGPLNERQGDPINPCFKCRLQIGAVLIG